MSFLFGYGEKNTTNPFPSFEKDEIGEPVIESIQIWHRYDATDWIVFFLKHGLIILLVLGGLIVVLEGLRLYREYADPSSPFKLYGRIPSALLKKKE